jgi:hypothetical protein
MKASIPRRLIALSAVVAAAACGPVQATSATRAQLGAPQWLDQTVYWPNDAALDVDCDCRFDRHGAE